MSNQNRDKTKGLPLPSPVDPGSTVCVSLMIPDAPEYIQAFRGVIADLGKYWAWSRTLGESDAPAQEAAELWRLAANTIMYSEDCEGAMSCGQVKNCIDTDPATRTSIQSLVTTQTAPGTYSTPGQPMTLTQSSARLNVLEGCNHDEFWAQCDQLVDYFIQAGTDVLEAIEVYTNGLEAAGFVEMVPLLGTLFDELQVDQFLEFLDWVVETLTEWYVAADTVANRNAIKCALFCAGFDDCLITIDRVWAVLNDRLGGILNPGDLDSLGDVANALVTLFTNPALALDAWLVFVTGSAKLAGYLGVKGIDQTLTLILKLAINDASNDWELLCEDCVPPTETRTPVINSLWDPANMTGTLSGPDEDGVWTVTTGTRASDEAFVIMDTLGRQFKLTDVVYSSTPSCQVMSILGTPFYLSCGVGNQYTNQVMDEFWTTWASGAHQTMQFKMVAP